MESIEIYQGIIENIRNKNAVTQNMNKVGNPDERNALLALEAVYIDEDLPLAKSYLEKISEDDLEGFSKGLYKEALLAIKSRRRRKTPMDELLDLANEVLETFPNAAIALAIRGLTSLVLCNIKRGTAYYLKILDYYPGAVWVYHNLARNLYAVNKKKEARKYIPKIKPLSTRLLYYGAVLFSFPFSLPFYLLYIYWFFGIGSINALLLLFIPLGLTLYALAKEDKVLVRHFLSFSIFLIVMTFILAVITG